MFQSKKIIRADSAQVLPYTGKSIGVAVLDTGIYPHEDFIYPYSRISAFKDFVNNKTYCYDDNGHGTHICGIIAGNGYLSEGRYAGMAPSAHLIVGKVLDHQGNGLIYHLLDAINWVIANQSKFNIRILNISVGSETSEIDEEKSILVKSVNRAWDHNITVVVAAGNNGPKRMSVTSPGISRKVITVGSSDDHKSVINGNVRIHNYSGRGPTRGLVPKPDIVAPGSEIISCSIPYHQRPAGYTARSGTSMSTPIVSGAVALFLEKYPYYTNEQIKYFLQTSTTDLNLPRNQQGFGLLNMEYFINAPENLYRSTLSHTPPEHH